MDVSVILGSINLALNDSSNVIHSEATKITAINEAIELIVKLDPKANAETGVISLIAGIVQSLAAGSERLLALHYNTNVSGSTLGRAIKITTKEKLDSIDPTWPSEASGSEVREYCYDPDVDPMTFMVRPPLSGGGYALAAVSKIPTDLTADDDTFPLRDSYRHPTVEFALYRLFSRDAVGTDNYTRGQGHYEKGMQMMGMWEAVGDKKDVELRQDGNA